MLKFYYNPRSPMAIRADAYAASSSSVIPSAYAAIGKAAELEVNII
ncbi:MAG: hypothetical protein SWZ49_04195 [Cyanobacteriota bacterium]|nr:hypothetical protein [Cyanobacteriota bacterium]